MKYNCICTLEYTPPHIMIAGKYERNYKVKQGETFDFTLKPAMSWGSSQYILTSNTGHIFELDRDQFRLHFSIKSHIRNRKLEQLGIN